ncbi:unnamed protein product [Xylocopa violacea]|uniref:Uncharacterized protein n=1 Tax=Xylocopa violacea TaxID=135666 RepID=A0ABP1P5T9_XYLVO
MPSTSSHSPPSSPAPAVNALHQQPWSSIQSSISCQCPPPAAMVLHAVQQQQSMPSTSSHGSPSSPASAVNALHQQPWSSIQSSTSGQGHSRRSPDYIRGREGTDGSESSSRRKTLDTVD